MKTFKQFISEMDEGEKPFIIWAIEKAVGGRRKLYMHLRHPDGFYDAEGFVDEVFTNKNGSLYIDFKEWSSEEGEYVPSSVIVDAEDIQHLTIKKRDGRPTLVFKKDANI
jgi:hypothetical protein